MSMDSALIIFTKNALLGKVKTRLAKTAGNKNALLIYNELLKFTKNLILKVKTKKFIFYSDFIDANDIFNAVVFEKYHQKGNDLGERMLNAFKVTFKLGYERTILIGSDCNELTPEILELAIKALDENDLVIGPAKDGGYYLIGMKKLHPKLFVDKNWGTATVFKEAIFEAGKLNLKYHLLPVLNDIDNEQDLGDLSKLIIRDLNQTND